MLLAPLPMDGYAIELGFGPKAEAKLSKIGVTIANAGLHSEFVHDENKPHITLATIHSKSDPDEIKKVTAKFAQTLAPFDVTFHSVAQFATSQNAIYLAPLLTGTMLSMYQRFHDSLTTAGLETGFYYRRGAWTPHTTITMKGPSQDIGKSIQIVRQASVFNIPLPISTIKVVWYAPFKLINQFPLLG